MELLMTIRQLVAHAIHDRICGWCSKTITPFRDHLSKVEYQISALCQTCQDQTFGGSDETN